MSLYPDMLLFVNALAICLTYEIEFSGVTFAHFKKTCGMTDRILSTNPIGPDVEHPIYMSRIQLVDVDEKSKLFAHHPQLK